MLHYTESAIFGTNPTSSLYCNSALIRGTRRRMARERKETYIAHMNKKMWRDNIYSNHVSNSRDVHEDVSIESRRWKDMRSQDKIFRCEGCEMRRCEEAEKRWEGVKMQRFQDGGMWRWEDDRCGCADVRSEVICRCVDLAKKWCAAKLR